MHKRLFAFILASILLHLLLGGGSLILPKQEPTNSVAIEIDLMKSGHIAMDPKLSDKQQRQLVEQNPSKATEEPEDAKYLSEKNQKVDKESVAQNTGEFRNSKSLGMAKDAFQKSRAIKPDSLPMKKPEKFDLAKAFKTIPQSDVFSGKENVRDKSESLADKTKKDLRSNNDLGLKDESEQIENFSPNDLPAGTMDVSRTSDYLKDVDKGLETIVNAKEFKYYSYYTRIRKQLSQHWEPLVKEKFKRLHHNGRAPAASTQDRITKLMIILSSSGNLVKIHVIADSGVVDLDEAAVEAFKLAAPFPNPPKGIVEQDGMVRIRWDFILET